MPLPTCNPWPANTVRFSDQISACLAKSAGAGPNELPEEVFLAVVLDSLQRLAVDGVAGFQNLNQYVVCEGEANAHQAFAQFNFVSLPIQASASQLKQQILWMLANPLCANSA